MTDTRKPAACAICYAHTALGVAARKRVHGLWACDTHAEALRTGQPLIKEKP